MSIILSLVKRTTKITIGSCYEAAAQRNNAIRRPQPPKPMLENSNRNETLTLNFSKPIANIRKIKPLECPFLT